MKKGGLIAVSAVIFIFAIVIFLGVYLPNAISGRASFDGQSGNSDARQIGPSQQEQQCMMQCMSCSSPGVKCIGDEKQCMEKCNVRKPEQTEDEKCVEACVLKTCKEFDFSCQQKNQAVCDNECGMIKEPEARSEEEQCIRDCVKKESPKLVCESGEGGEKGSPICQKCAKQCEHLYAGPCLTEAKLEEKKSACNTCEHCYGEPIIGDSGEGYQCIVNIECKDASSEFGDDPGTGESTSEKTQLTEKITDTAKNVVKALTNFFKNLFGGKESKQETKESEQPNESAEFSESENSQ